MFKYVGDINIVTHSIIQNFLEDKAIAIDATLGNGYDTDFLSENFQKVYAFDIQKIACESYLKRDNVIIINDCHSKFNNYINEKVNCIMYNLGFLPGGNKEITTMHETSLKSIKYGLELLAHGGIMSICIYTGHHEGEVEKSCIIQYLKELPKSKYGVMQHSFINRNNNPPLLLIIEKK